MKSNLLQRALTGSVIVAVIVGASVYDSLTASLLWGTVTVGALHELRANKMGGILGAIYILIAGAATHRIGYLNGEYDGWLTVSLFTAIWTNDSMAYLGGTSLGRKFFSRGLAPSISPKKSWEGTIIGLLFAGLVGYLWYGELGIILGMMVGALATASDLIESAAKRKVGIKDSGTLFPGHGGVLDRFDSLGLTAPMVIIVVTLFRLL